MGSADLIVYLILNTVLAAIIGMWGESRKIGFWPAFLLSVFLSGIIGIVAVVISEPLPKKEFIHQSAAKTGTADELIKFKSLLDAGAITQDEYDQQKAKLLK